MESEYTKLEEDPSDYLIPGSTATPPGPTAVPFSLVTMIIHSIIALIAIEYMVSSQLNECGINIQSALVVAVLVLLSDSFIIFIMILLSTELLRDFQVTPGWSLRKITDSSKLLVGVCYVAVSAFGIYAYKLNNECEGKYSRINELTCWLIMYFLTMSVFIAASYMQGLVKGTLFKNQLHVDD